MGATAMSPPYKPITPDHFDAVLFDLDGVLTSTAKIHSRCWKTMFDGFLGRRAVAGKERSDRSISGPITSSRVSISWCSTSRRRAELADRWRGVTKAFVRFEVKLADPGGKNVWWHSEEAFALHADWQPMRIRSSRLEFAWGPAGGGAMSVIAAIAFLLTGCATNHTMMPTPVLYTGENARPLFTELSIDRRRPALARRV